MWKMSDWRDTCTEFKCVSHAWNHNIAISVLLFSSCKKCKLVSDFIQFFIQQKNPLFPCNKTTQFQLFGFLSLTIYRNQLACKHLLCATSCREVIRCMEFN